MKKFHQQLRAAREALGLSGHEVARRADVWQSNYSLWETGKKKPNRETLAKLAEVLDCRFIVDADGTRLVPNEPPAAE